MAIASRSARSSGLNFKGVFFAGMALFFVVGLFFIPEIIGFFNVQFQELQRQ